MAEIVELDSSFKFPQFDVVSDHSDHYYYLLDNRKSKSSSSSTTTNGHDCFSEPSSAVHRKITKEWRVLEKNLPETIYVRVYEQRMDLMRAVIVGPAGTPYHDGLFVFDIRFPPDYPTRPPSVHYRSFGLRINPNLYANGFVCLSLLNTWMGKKSEKWNPNESTMLQILVSIQGLVLNGAPYFNEPGTGIFPGRTKKSIVYTENAFILNCKTMVYLLRKPPMNFEDFVRWHFRRRAGDILSACDAYVNTNTLVGSYTTSGSDCGSGEVSKNFKANMRAWYPQMVVAFRGAGATVRPEVEKLGEEQKTVSFKAEKKTKKEEKGSSKKIVPFKPVVIKKVVRKIKKILGLKKVVASENLIE